MGSKHGSFAKLIDSLKHNGCTVNTVYSESHFSIHFRKILKEFQIHPCSIISPASVQVEYLVSNPQLLEMKVPWKKWAWGLMKMTIQSKPCQQGKKVSFLQMDANLCQIKGASTPSVGPAGFLFLRQRGPQPLSEWSELHLEFLQGWPA